MDHIWVVESGEHEQRGINFVADSVETCVEHLKNTFESNHPIKWGDVTPLGNENSDSYTIQARFIAEDGSYLGFDEIFSIERYKVITSNGLH